MVLLMVSTELESAPSTRWVTDGEVNIDPSSQSASGLESLPPLLSGSNLPVPQFLHLQQGHPKDASLRLVFVITMDLMSSHIIKHLANAEHREGHCSN